MIRLKLIRDTYDKKLPYTTGILFNADTMKVLAYTLEDKVRDLNKDGDLDDPGEGKVKGETAIPFGFYHGFLRMSPSRGRIVPQLKEVRNFKYIQIHAGNTVRDSLGCILVGYNRKEGKIWNSRKAERDLVNLIQKHGGLFTINII